MAHHKSALKRIKIGERNRQRNRFRLSTLRTEIKQVLNSKNKEEAVSNYESAASVLDKMVKKRILHKNTASNKKARLMRYVNSLT
jgi:small subunit ribosomal protein S20